MWRTCSELSPCSLTLFLSTRLARQIAPLKTPFWSGLFRAELAKGGVVFGKGIAPHIAWLGFDPHCGGCEQLRVASSFKRGGAWPKLGWVWQSWGGGMLGPKVSRTRAEFRQFRSILAPNPTTLARFRLNLARFWSRQSFVCQKSGQFKRTPCYIPPPAVPEYWTTCIAPA